MSTRSSFERLIVSDTRQRASAAPGAWQLSTPLATFFLLFFGAAFGAGIRQTAYPALAWVVFIALAAFIASKMDGFDSATQRARQERDDMQVALDVALGELDRVSNAARTLAKDNAGLRASLETSQALAAGVASDYAATWQTERMEAA
jgi:hypothetical protein